MGGGSRSHFLHQLKRKISSPWWLARIRSWMSRQPKFTRIPVPDVSVKEKKAGVFPPGFFDSNSAPLGKMNFGRSDNIDVRGTSATSEAGKRSSNVTFSFVFCTTVALTALEVGRRDGRTEDGRRRGGRRDGRWDGRRDEWTDTRRRRDGHDGTDTTERTDDIYIYIYIYI